MEPRVQYVKTPDGVNLAYYEMGEGAPLVFANMPFSHLTEEWRIYGPLFTGIAASARLVRFDPRGFGLSDRNPEDISLDAYTMDLETIFDRLDLPPAVLNANVLAGAPGTMYAARHPERLTHLVLVEAAARAPEIVVREARAALRASNDWRFVSEALLRFIQGWDRPEESAEAAALLRESLTLEGAKRFIEAFVDFDITPVLPAVKTQTLVVNTKDNPWAGVECGREVATGIPNAQFVVTGAQPSANAVLEQVVAVRSFLGGSDGRDISLSPQQRTDVGTTIICFADIADSTALTERLGDTAFRERSRELDARLRSIIRERGGSVIDAKTLGDGVATFASAAQAIDAALRFEAAAEASQLQLHVGLHAGDVLREADAAGRNNVFGGAVNIAARISGLSAAREVLVSDVVRLLARTSVLVTFEDRGEHLLKGVADPQRVYAVRPNA